MEEERKVRYNKHLVYGAVCVGCGSVQIDEINRMEVR